MNDRHAEKQLPEGFFWGASISSMQTEGGIVGSDWARADRDGVVPPIGNAVQHFERFSEDIALVSDLNLNAFRISIEWARVEPQEGVFDEEAIAHYVSVVKAMREKGIEPFVCLWHFSVPEWFSASGAFTRRDAAAIFERYVRRVVGALSGEVTYFLTMNEPLVWLFQHGRTVGSAPSMWQPHRVFTAYRALITAHRRAYQAIHEVHPAAKVGVAKHNIVFRSGGLFGFIVAPLARVFWNRLFLSSVATHSDFIGLQYYQTISVGSVLPKKEAMVSDIGWGIHPEGIYDVVMEAARYKLPIIISESGIADAKDQYRAQFIADSVRALHRALTDGAQVFGYLHWALLDNYEFTEGFAMKFGLVEVIREKNNERSIRDSARVYADIAARNGL